jgi:hypothetical protein
VTASQLTGTNGTRACLDQRGSVRAVLCVLDRPALTNWKHRLTDWKHRLARLASRCARLTSQTNLHLTDVSVCSNCRLGEKRTEVKKEKKIFPSRGDSRVSLSARDSNLFRSLKLLPGCVTTTYDLPLSGLAVPLRTCSPVCGSISLLYSPTGYNAQRRPYARGQRQLCHLVTQAGPRVIRPRCLPWAGPDCTICRRQGVKQEMRRATQALYHRPGLRHVPRISTWPRARPSRPTSFGHTSKNSTAQV